MRSVRFAQAHQNVHLVAGFQFTRHFRGLFTYRLFVARRLLAKEIGPKTFDAAWPIKFTDFICEHLAFTCAGKQAHKRDKAQCNDGCFEVSHHSGIDHHNSYIVKTTGFIGQIDQAFCDLFGGHILTKASTDFIIRYKVGKTIRT